VSQRRMLGSRRCCSDAQEYKCSIPRRADHGIGRYQCPAPGQDIKVSCEHGSNDHHYCPPTRLDIFSLFDRATLLSRASVAYTGLASDCLLRFNGLLPGELRPRVDPADYLIDIVVEDTRTKEVEEE